MFNEQAVTYVTKEFSKLLDKRQKQLNYPTKAEFLRAVLIAGINRCQAYDPMAVVDTDTEMEVE